MMLLDRRCMEQTTTYIMALLLHLNQFCYLLETSKGASRLLSGERAILFRHEQPFDPEALKS
jgi:hypothetical protein